MKIYLNDKTTLDLTKLITSRLLAVANSGGGKSWLIRRIVEQAFGKVQIIILDPEGEFSTLREKFDFILCGKGMDAPAETRSAGLLARKLLESKSSAIIDLYELHPQERKHFVKLFLESMTNAPKELYNDCLIILDEAHRFAPEKEEAESLNAVVEMASLGRKRGFCLIPVTQRVSKLSKDVAAECNNKLMGRASLDLDRKRTADELGIRDRDEILALRNLEPGEFFAFGPAISNDVIRVKVGLVQTSMPKAGRATKVAPPSAKLKKELAALADLPQEAEQEARTVVDLTRQVKSLTAQLKNAPPQKSPQEMGPMGVSQWRDYGKKYGYWDWWVDKLVTDAKADSQKLIKQYIVFINKMLHLTGERAKAILDGVDQLKNQMPKGNSMDEQMQVVHISGIKKSSYIEVEREINEKRTSIVKEHHVPASVLGTTEKAIGTGERTILIACAQHGGCTRQQLTVLTQYKRSSRDAFVQRLKAKGFVDVSGEKIVVTPDGEAALGGNYEPLPTGPALQEHLMRTLPEGEKKVLQILIEAYPNAVERETITEMLGEGYQRSSRDAYIQRLSARQLIIKVGRGEVKASENLFHE